MKNLKLKLDGGQFLVDAINSLVIHDEEDLYDVSNWLGSIDVSMEEQKDSEEEVKDFPFDEKFSKRIKLMIAGTIKSGQLKGNKAVVTAQLLKAIKELEKPKVTSDGLDY